MKNIKLILCSIFLAFAAVSCSEDGISNDLSSLDNVAPDNINNIFDITNDNSGLVKITPTAEGASSFDVFFGDGTTEPVNLKPGQGVNHIYAEGSYTVNIVTNDIAGGKTETQFPLQVTFRAPENLVVTTSTNAHDLTLAAKADYARSFLVFFGDVPNEVGTPMAIGQTLNHTYELGGVYDVKVIAESGGAAKTESVKQVIIFDPLAFPYTVELASQNYLAGGTFGGVNFSIADNPFPTGLNTSSKVVKFEKPVGAEEWAGTWKPLGVPIDLSTGTKITMLVYATEVGKNIGLELQASTNGAPNTAIFSPVLVANQWTEVVFDTTTIPAIPVGATYKQFNINYNRPNKGLGEVIYIDNIQVTN
ncbi:MAG: hypothetical protein U1C58_05610 [Flavobacteriaceae bacterium]|nr:hypothetical protein [Flavobacteriaceae bacterium]